MTIVQVTTVPAAMSRLNSVDDKLPGLRAQPQERAELVGGDAGITDHGQHFDLLLDQPA